MSETLHPAVNDTVQTINAALHERDDLRKKNTDLQNRANVAEQLAEHLVILNTKLTDERDLYMRQALVFSTSVNTIMDLCASLGDKIAAETAKPRIEQPQPEDHAKAQT